MSSSKRLFRADKLIYASLTFDFLDFRGMISTVERIVFMCVWFSYESLRKCSLKVSNE